MQTRRSKALVRPNQNQQSALNDRNVDHFPSAVYMFCMEPQTCILCKSPAILHFDERRNQHVSCAHCGSYIAAQTFAEHFAKIDPEPRSTFTAWMAQSKNDAKRYLFKTRPLKDNPYSKQDGFQLISIAQIKTNNVCSHVVRSGHGRAEEAVSRET